MRVVGTPPTSAALQLHLLWLNDGWISEDENENDSAGTWTRMRIVADHRHGLAARRESRARVLKSFGRSRAMRGIRGIEPDVASEAPDSSRRAG